MQKIELEFDEQTIERARQLALQRQISLEEWLKIMIKQLVTVWSPPTLTAWELEKEFIRQRTVNVSSPTPLDRNWTREEIYSDRLSG